MVQAAKGRRMGLIERLSSEITYFRGAIRTLRRVSAIARDSTHTVPDMLDDLAQKYADRTALIGGGRSYKYGMMNSRANQYAHWAQSIGIRHGDNISLMMGNCPEYLAIWFGLVRAGARVALLNTNLSGQSLAHCMNIVPCRHTIFSGEFLDVFNGLRPHLAAQPQLWVAGHGNGQGHSLYEAVSQMPPTPLPPKRKPRLTNEDPALYIYTSGTTGLPKAAIISHYRVQAVMNGFSSICDAQPDDRIYVAQPLYHTAGGVLAVGITLTAGGAVVIRDKFSARHFWDDIVEHECTAFQYIGELCRYLLNAPTSENETRHSLRFCNGNGLRPDIWMSFKTRFRIPKIIEWYAATEGNVTMFNLDGKPGSVGRIPKWLEHRFQTKLVRYNVETEQPVRGPDGHCIECAPDETGEAIGKIVIDPDRPAQRFDGYSDREATEKKILHNVFQQGDAWFRTGDLMRKDRFGYFYFIDRIGDTFRWKEENVSTSEVEEVMSIFPGVREVNVYGVQVPLHNGRAGMAAIVSDEGLDLAALHTHLQQQLPSYARPVFLRIQRALDITSTFKVKKVDLRNQGFDPRRCGDPVYFNNPESIAFEPLDLNLFKKIEVGDFRL